MAIDALCETTGDTRHVGVGADALPPVVVDTIGDLPLIREWLKEP